MPRQRPAFGVGILFHSYDTLGRAWKYRGEWSKVSSLKYSTRSALISLLNFSPFSLNDLIKRAQKKKDRNTLREEVYLCVSVFDYRKGQKRETTKDHFIFKLETKNLTER